MKRITAACICQTLCFSLKEQLPHEDAQKLVRDEVARYKAQLERSRTKYRITDEAEQADGSVVLQIIKQYNQSDVGAYLN